MTIENLIEKYEKSIESLEEAMSLFDDEGGAVYASFAREVEIYETVIADLQDLAQKQGDLISREALKKEFIKEFYTALGQGEDSFDVIGTMTKVIDNAPTVEPKLSDEQIEKITDLLETEWGYEGIREDISRILRGKEE